MAFEIRSEISFDAEQYWEQLMVRGTVLLEQDDVVGALVNFEQACILASSLPERWDEVDDALAAVVVSHLNFADALARACRIEQAASVLCGLHARLLRAANDAVLTPAARQSVLRHLRETAAALLEFQVTHGMRRDMQQSLHEAWYCGAHVPPVAAELPQSMTLH